MNQVARATRMLEKVSPEVELGIREKRLIEEAEQLGKLTSFYFKEQGELLDIMTEAFINLFVGTLVANLALTVDREKIRAAVSHPTKEFAQQSKTRT